jgi:hypothetical protein
MSANLVRIRFKWKVACAMSDYMELINPKTRICKLIKDGEVVAEYKMEQCDKCSLLAKIDEFGYQRGIDGEKLLWFCGSCR